MSALALCLDRAATPFLGEPTETRFERSTAGVVVDGCGVDAVRVANPEHLEVGFEGVTDEDGCRATLGCDDGEELGLDLGVIVAVARDASVMPDHLDGGW